MTTLQRQKVKLRTRVRRYLSDTLTPVTLYLKARDHFTEPVLLENNDFRNKEDCYSFLGLGVIGSFRVQNGRIATEVPGQKAETSSVSSTRSVPEAMMSFLQQFEVEYEQPYDGFNGLIGYTGFDAVQYFDTLRFDPDKRKLELPDMRYNLYQIVIAINHFRDELVVLENLPERYPSRLEEVEQLLRSQQFATHQFRLEGQESSNLSDEGFMELVRLGKKHCQLGDVFQIVFSRQFAQRFSGDDFNVYRVLRSINPSPYLFYADFGSYRVFGSSPETQMAIKDHTAVVNPIAGTYRRSGDLEEDTRKALELSEDPKENAEHIMLVDLARNDLGRHATKVAVEQLKEIQYFSHVIHLVSKVTGKLGPGTNPVQIFGDTFPAGTLSGAPKYKALELINRYENQNRATYGGALGYINFDGEMNKAILIRSFLSRNHTLYYQAGAGIVNDSVPEKELQEVNNKLGALTKALSEAEKL